MAITLVAPHVASACSCVDLGSPPCQTVWEADAVFVGTVVSVRTDNPALEMWAATRVYTLTVDRVFTGSLTSKQLEMSSGGGGTCGYEFDVGRTYLVYARRDKTGVLSTSLCSPTKPLENASVDLAYLEHIPEERPGAPVYGEVVRLEYQKAGTPPARTPVWPAIVRLTSDTASFAAATDEKGHYRFEAVPPGYYSRTVLASGSYSARSTDGFITVRETRGCVHDDIWARVDRSVKGRLTSGTGQPLGEITVELVDTPSEAIDVADAAGDGTFRFAEVAPGRYMLRGNLNRGAGAASPALCRTAGTDAPLVLTVGELPGELNAGQCVLKP